MRRTYNFQRPGTRSRVLPALQWCRSAALVGCLPVAVVASAWDGGQPAGGVAAQATRGRPEPAHVALRLVGQQRCRALLPVDRPAWMYYYYRAAERMSGVILKGANIQECNEFRSNQRCS